MYTTPPDFCTRVVYFASDDDPQYPYRGAGTAFLAWFGDTWFLLTARHVFDKGKASELFVAKAQGGRESIALNKLLRSDDLDSDYKDLVVLYSTREKAPIWSATL